MKENVSLSRRQALKGAGVVAIGTAAGLLPLGKAEAARAKAPRWAFIVDLRRCTGCRSCTVACKAEFNTPLGAFRAAVYEEVHGKYPKSEKLFLPRLCNHCEGNKTDEIPPCVKVCPEYPKGRKKYTTPDGKTIRYRYGATYKRPDGLILFENDLCVGCGKCIDKCPYGARNWDMSRKSGKDPTKQSIVKCSFCQHRIDQGVVPSCVNTCPPGARKFGDLNDPNSEVSKLVKEFGLETNRNKTTLLPAEDTVPMLFYIDPKGAVTRMANAKRKFEQNQAWLDLIG
jgi:tetrathionate reductase subunit B